MQQVQVPPSKSVTQRALVLAALSAAPVRLIDPLDCDDSRAMCRGLSAFGVHIDIGDGVWQVVPPRRLRVPRAPLHLDNAGTAVRFLAAFSLLCPGPFLLDGNAAMRRRPMASLIAALRTLGAEVEERGLPGCPPLFLSPPARVRRPATAIPFSAGFSSQELSSLLLVGSRLEHGLRLRVRGKLPSRPYVNVTRAVLSDFGVEVSGSLEAELSVPGCTPARESYAVEGDWSSASYPLAGGWLTGRPVSITNVRAESAQGDRHITAILQELEAPREHRLEMRDVPDLVPTVAACALFADAPTEIHGVAHLRVKESDRLAVFAGELAKLGARAHELDDGLRIEPAPLRGPAVLDPRQDHRLAMAFGLIALRVAGVEVRDAGCVSKSYPGFWGMLESLR